LHFVSHDDLAYILRSPDRGVGHCKECRKLRGREYSVGVIPGVGLLIGHVHTGVGRLRLFEFQLSGLEALTTVFAFSNVSSSTFIYSPTLRPARLINKSLPGAASEGVSRVLTFSCHWKVFQRG